MTDLLGTDEHQDLTESQVGAICEVLYDQSKFEDVVYGRAPMIERSPQQKAEAEFDWHWNRIMDFLRMEMFR